MKAINILAVLALFVGIGMAEEDAGDWSADSWQLFGLSLVAHDGIATITNGGNTDRAVGELLVVQGTTVLGQIQADEVLVPGQSVEISISGGQPGANIRLTGTGGMGVYARGKIMA